VVKRALTYLVRIAYFIQHTYTHNPLRLHCVNGDRLSQWRMTNFYPPYRIETCEPINIKFGTRDYVRETTRCAKCGANPSTGDFWANRGNITLFVFLILYTFFLQLTYRSYPSTDFDARWLKRRVFTQGSAFGSC